MAVEGVGSPKVQKKQQIPETSGPVVDRASVLARLDGALKNRVLSEEEVKALATDLGKLPPPDQAAVIAKLQADLKSAQGAGAPVRIQDATLNELKKLPGLNPKVLLDIEKYRDKTVTHSVTQGLEKTATTADEVHSDARKKQTSDNRNERIKLDRAARGKGTEPFSLDGRSQDAAMALLSYFDDRLTAKLPDEAKAMREAMGPEIKNIAGAVLREMSPEARAAMGTARDALLAGDTAALKAAIGESFSGVLDATNKVIRLGEGDPAAMSAILGASKTLVEHLPAQWQAGGNRVVAELTKALGKLGPKVAADVATKGANVAKGASVAKGANVAVKTAQVVTQGADVVGKTAKAAQVGAEAVQVGAQVAQTAQVGVGAVEVAAGATSAAAKSIPGANIIAGGIATGLSGLEFIGECRRKPKSWGRFFASGLNTVLQITGIVIPGVGAVATLGKFGADAAFDAHEKKAHGAALEHNGPDLKSMAPALKEYGELGSTFLSAFGYEDAAQKTKAWAHTAETLGNLTAKDVAHMSAEQREAMYQQVAAMHSEVGMVVDDPSLKDSPQKAGAHLLGEALRKLMGALRKARTANTDEARAEVVAEAMNASAKAAAAAEVGTKT